MVKRRNAQRGRSGAHTILGALWKRLTPGQLRLAGNVGACGSLADGQSYPQTLGGQPELVAVPGRDRRGVSSSCGAHLAPGDFEASVRGTVLWGTRWGQLDGVSALS